MNDNETNNNVRHGRVCGECAWRGDAQRAAYLAYAGNASTEGVYMAAVGFI